MAAGIRVLIALVAGLTLGILLSGSESRGTAILLQLCGAMGTVFINAIRMTVMPLVVSKLVSGIAGAADGERVERLGIQAFVLFLGLLVAGSVFAVIVAPPLIGRIDIPPDVAERLREAALTASSAAAADAANAPGILDWFVGLVPANVFEAAATGNILPVILFSLLLGFALTRLDGPRRQGAVTFFDALGEALLHIIRWVLVLAPAGVFGLAVPLGTRLGVAAAEALVSYIVIMGACCAAFSLLVLYPAAALWGAVPIGTFAKAILPAQAIAFSSRSSLASLPVMIEQSRNALNLPGSISGFFLPLAASTFRVGSAVGLPVASMFVARLYGIELSAVDLAAIVFTTIITTFGSLGVPSGAVILIVPILSSAGIPPEGMGVLLGVDTLPDMFRTTTNITGDMAAASILGAREGSGQGGEQRERV